MNDIYGIINGDSDFILDELIKKGVRYDLILTDPPYNINKDFGNTSDCLTIDEFRKITQLRVQKLKKLLTPTGSIIWFGIHNYICYVQIAMYDAAVFSNFRARYTTRRRLCSISCFLASSRVMGSLSPCSPLKAIRQRFSCSRSKGGGSTSAPPM